MKDLIVLLLSVSLTTDLPRGLVRGIPRCVYDGIHREDYDHEGSDLKAPDGFKLSVDSGGSNGTLEDGTCLEGVVQWGIVLVAMP